MAKIKCRVCGRDQNLEVTPRGQKDSGFTTTPKSWLCEECKAKMAGGPKADPKEAKDVGFTVSPKKTTAVRAGDFTALPGKAPAPAPAAPEPPKGETAAQKEQPKAAAQQE
jgi:hypothetical protein